jgi:hypothetical protein
MEEHFAENAMKQHLNLLGANKYMRKTNDNNKNSINLRDYFDTRFNELKEYMNIKFNSIEKATNLASDNLNTRLEGMNEFRASMKDQTANFITRTEHEALVTKMDSDIKYAVSQIKSDVLQEQARTRWMVTEVVIIFGIVITIVFAVINYFKI